MTPDHVTDAVIARYLEGHCTASEAREISAWMDADPIHRARVDELRTIWTVGPVEQTWNADAIWARLRLRMGDGATLQRRPRIHRAVQRRWGAPIAIAASLLIVAGGAAVLSTVRRPSSVPPLAAPAHEYATGRGERATVHLADGSVVTLAAGSRISIPADFGHMTRELRLDGEAVFDVVHDAARPFRVRAKAALVEDVGTRFDVRAYADEPVVAVAVAQGDVSLARRTSANDSGFRARTAAGRVLLGRGQLAQLAADGHITNASEIQLPRYFGWTDGQLVFTKTPLPDVLRTIGRWYDLEIRVSDPVLAGRLVSAEFSTQMPDEMVEALAAAVDARFERDGRVVTLRPVP